MRAPWRKRRLARGRGKAAAREPAFQPVGEARQAEAQDEVGQAQDQVDLRRLGEHLRVDLRRDERHLGQPDDVAQRGLLDGRDELVHQRGQHAAQRLRQHHQAHGAAVAQAQCAGGFHLAARQALDAGAHDLGQVGGVEHHQRDQHGGELVGLDAGHAGQEEVGPEDHHQERQAAHHEHEARDGPAQPAPRAHARQPERDAQRQRQHQPARGQQQREHQAAERAVRVLPDEEVDPVVVDDFQHVACPQMVRTGNRCWYQVASPVMASDTVR
jgi:hypothetical protein